MLCNALMAESISRQCHRLPICFFTSDMTTKKNKNPEKSDCETSWLDSIAVSVFVDWLSLSNTDESNQIQVTI